MADRLKTELEAELTYGIDLAEEVGRLTNCLIEANRDTEEFERKFYLEQIRAEDAEADTKRLDWLMEQAAIVKTDGSGGWYVYFDWLPAYSQYGPRGDGRRAAIDAAMAEPVYREGVPNFTLPVKPSD